MLFLRQAKPLYIWVFGLNWMKILFVCLGNICRSPMAEAIMKKKAIDAGLDLHIESAGTNQYHKGGPADERTLKICLENGVDLSRHIARRFRTSDFAVFDRIICLAQEVADEMAEFVTHAAQWEKVTKLEVGDPWYGGDKEFLECFRHREQICENVLYEFTTGINSERK